MIRVVVCGDDGVGKSSLITTLVKDRFVPNIEDVLPPLVIPQNDRKVMVVDTSPELSNRHQLSKEIRTANVIWLVFSDNYTFERITLFWLPFLRSIGVNLPIILCQNKLDLHNEDEDEDEIVDLITEFKEIESFIRCSAKDKVNVVEAFYFCVRAVTSPLAPLFDSKEGSLKPLAYHALSRVFFLCDQDQTGYLSDEEFLGLQYACFQTRLSAQDMQEIHTVLQERELIDEVLIGAYTCEYGISKTGFLILNQIYAEKGRHETIWGILRHFHYTDSLSLDDKFLHPKIDVPETAHIELSPDGYKFLVDLFTLFDKDNDGGLSQEELDNLFTPTPGYPKLWIETQFPLGTVRNEQGYVTLQGWLAQWSMTCFLDYRDTIAYLAMLGYETKYGQGKLKSALKTTRPARQRNPRSKLYRNSVIRDRNVFHCILLGASMAGKSSLLDAFLQRNFKHEYSPTIPVRMVVNSVEMPGGKQCYLILQELGELEPAILENQKRLDQCDILCCVYDSADPDSFSHLVELREKYPQIDQLPVVYAALKADLDRQQQRTDEQPDQCCTRLGLNIPMHVSAEWPASLNALFMQLVEAAQNPGSATPRIGEIDDDSFLELALTVGTAGAAVGVLYWFWRKYA